MKILVIGSNGQLGRSIQKITSNSKHNNEFTFVDRACIDLSNEDSINNYFRNHSFDLIINCAAFTQVDEAENKPVLANLINNIAVELLAKISKNTNTFLIHISTDYVFDGEISSQYSESDLTNPINIYGKTKLLGEQKIQSLMPINAIIIRTSWLYSEFGKNFVASIIKNAQKKKTLDVINDQFGSPTYATDLANSILKIVTSIANFNFKIETQIYHFSNSGECSWYDFACEIIRQSNIDCIVRPINSNDYIHPTKRPKNTTMSKNKIIEKFDLNIRHWKSSLADYFELLKAN
jgi:dTDP-4-dehydrorhamnose reductase